MSAEAVILTARHEGLTLSQEEILGELPPHMALASMTVLASAFLKALRIPDADTPLLGCEGVVRMLRGLGELIN